MLRTIKPKNARSKRALKKREPKVNENPKTALFIRGSTTSHIVNDALTDLYSLKKPDAVNFTKKNPIHPFDDDTPLTFLSQKNDSSLIVVGTHSKKRPHNLVFARMFDHQLMDMIEVGIEKSVPMAEFKAPKCAVGMRPLMVFNGEHWESKPELKHMRTMLLDFFRGQEADAINLAGLEHVISLTAMPSSEDDGSHRIFFRVYTIQLKKSGTRIPRIELEEMGPSFDWRIRRRVEPKDDMWKMAIKVPKELKPKRVKNVEKDLLGDKYGRVHLGRQDLSKLQTRKMKGLKKRPVGSDEEDDDDMDVEMAEISKKRRV
ncbi:uncharacterized protein VTP21DRAFT_5301 [Calcarisporiella thermophila]|uniref:uncharacterized protein n=1 Tax=Calcarisporiella thermophila TaxID=911321 RepID=UPI003743B34A